MFRHLHQDRVLQLLQGLSAQGVDGSVGNKYIFNLETLLDYFNVKAS